MSISGEWFIPKNLEFHKIKVRGPTEWTTFSLSDSNGISGQGEVTSTQIGVSVTSLIAKLADNLRGKKISSDYDVISFNNIQEKSLETNLPLATAVSGLRSALSDALSRQLRIPLFLYIRLIMKDPEIKKSKVKLYANINRSMLPNEFGKVERTPEIFAKMAKKAVENGFKTIKCAPFDECKSGYKTKGIPAEAEIGLDRVRAIRSVIDPEINLYIDCHSRFDENSADFIANELIDIGIDWFEEPVDPIEEKLLSQKIVSNCNVPVAGGEMGYGLSTFIDLINSNSLNIVMPDIKFCGGPTEAYRIGKELENIKKGTVSIHCPSGPISLLASAHATLAFGNILPLEHAVYENNWRHKILEPFEIISKGNLEIPDGEGLGAKIDPAIIAFHGKKWSE